MEALGVVGEREARPGLLEADAELLVLERAELRVEPAGLEEQLARERDVARVDVVPADLRRPRGERLRLLRQDARVEALEERHVRELRVRPKPPEDHGVVVGVLVEVPLEKIGLHLHVVVDDDDDVPRREVHATLPGDGRTCVLLPLDAQRVLRDEGGRTQPLPRVLLRAVVDRDDLVVLRTDRLVVELLEETAQEILPVERRDDDAHPEPVTAEPFLEGAH